MRVTITHRQEDSLLPSAKRHYVDCAILFSEEEKAIIRERGLGSHYISVDSAVPRPAASSPTTAHLLKALAPLVFLVGCVADVGMSVAGNGRGGDSVGGSLAFAALAMFLGGIALNRHIRVAEQPQQIVSLSRLINNPTFAIYALDNARAKAVDAELRESLVRLKEGLLVNRDKIAAETFEL